ncbi:MAG: hypothetical protein QOI13_2450 [Paraburkholderia sp.]|nr:hypothetical protein [Paraburkholderia sp.]
MSEAATSFTPAKDDLAPSPHAVTVARSEGALSGDVTVRVMDEFFHCEQRSHDYQLPLIASAGSRPNAVSVWLSMSIQHATTMRPSIR